MRERNQVVIPYDIEKSIPENDPVFKLVEICETMDYTRLRLEYIRVWRKTNPITLFILLVYAYMRRIYSSRQIEEACKTDIRFMWILGMEEAPDHSTIARFQNGKLAPVIEDLFYQLVEKLIEMNEVSYTNVFVDGTKIEANANKYSFVWTKAVSKNLKKLINSFCACNASLHLITFSNYTIFQKKCLTSPFGYFLEERHERIFYFRS